MRIFNISDARNRFSALIAKVEDSHEVIISRAGKPVARLVPYRVDTTPRELGGSWTGNVKIADDFSDVPSGWSVTTTSNTC